jgi:cytoskeletal protein RodZ
MSFSNEYWLIGIIIVLVTVVLMLIVYIVKIKQNATPAINNQSVPETSRRATIMEAATRTHELADKPFVAHSRAPKVVIEAVSEPEPEQEQEERAPEPEKEAPIFTMQSGPEPQIEEIPSPVPQPEPPQVAPARRRGGRTPK